MTPEEFQRIKEAEKQHLEAIKKLKQKLRQVEGKGRSKRSSLEQAMDEIENAPGDEILDTHEEMIDRLAMDAIHQEARLELALSSEKDADLASQADADSVSTSEADSAAEPDIAQSDEELKKLRAQELVRKMKIQMGLDNLKRKQEPVQNVTKKSNSEDSESSAAESGSEGEPPSNTLPDKTIGRIPKK